MGSAEGPMDVVEAKHSLRRGMKERLAALTSEAHRTDGERAARALLPFLIEQRRSCAGPVALFASLRDEIDTQPLDAALRDARIPRAFPMVSLDELVFIQLHDDVSMEQLERGVLGVPTPRTDMGPAVAATAFAAIVVPGLAFDTRGGRLGRGRGYYDRFLANVDRARAVGLLHDEQLVVGLPLEAHDERLRWLCTPARGVFAVDDDSARR